jgi:protein arginine phosphatase
MKTKTITVPQEKGYDEGVREAAAALDAGGLVIFPTETVYGIAARADKPDALRRLYEAKNRPADQPFTVHIGRRADVDLFVDPPTGIAKRFIRKAWPGPLTLLLTASDPGAMPIAAEGGADLVKALYWGKTIGLRLPDDVVATTMLQLTGGPVVAASANLAGSPPPRTADEALRDLDGRVDIALDGGPARYDSASTIVRIEGEKYDIVRQGVYDERMMRGFAQTNLLFVCTGNTCRSPMAGGLAERLIAERLGCSVSELGDRSVVVRSAGTGAWPDSPAADHAVAVLSKRDIDISSHASQRLTVELIQQADYVFTMTRSHRDFVLSMVPSADDRTFTLAADGDISDPIGGGLDVYAACADMIESALRTRLEEIDL